MSDLIAYHEAGHALMKSPHAAGFGGLRQIAEDEVGIAVEVAAGQRL